MLTEEQKRLRATGYGASEVACLVGAGYAKPSELFESKVNPKFDDDADQSLPSELGTLEEEPIAKVYARRTGTALALVGTMRHPTKPLALATPDRARFVTGSVPAVELITNHVDLEGADRLVEVKRHAARYRRDYGPADTGQVPEHEAIQVTWQMGVTGLRAADVAVLFSSDWGVKLEVFTVAFDEELFEMLYAAVERFHTDHVLKGIPPPPDGTEAYEEMMQRIYPKVVRKASVVADEHDERLMLDYAKFAEVERRAKQLKNVAAQHLMQRIGDAGGLVSPSLGELKWIAVREGTTISWKKAANDALALGGLVLNGLSRLRADEALPTPESLAELERRLKEILPEASKPKAGYRYLKLTPKGQAALELAQLNVALDALQENI